MTQIKSNTVKEKLDKKFKKAEAYLKRNGFSSLLQPFLKTWKDVKKNIKNNLYI